MAKNAPNKRYLKKRETMTKPIAEVKYQFSWWFKCLLVVTFPLWLIPFLFTNLIFGLGLRNGMEKFPRTGIVEHPNFVNISRNTLDFYNRDMEVQNAPQLKIDEEEWKMMEPQDISIATFDDVQLSAFMFINHSKINNEKWVIAAHGWQQNRYSILYLVKHFYEQGYNILTYDARGHGSNTVQSVTFGWKEASDLYAVIRYVSDYVVYTVPEKQAKISLIGNSMGATTILETCERFDVENLGVKCAIFDCGYDKLSNIIKTIGYQYFRTHWFWFYFGANFFFYIKDHFKLKNVAPINKLQYIPDLPVLFIHGEEDETVPLNMTKNLYNSKVRYETVLTISEILIIQNAKHVRAITTDYTLYCKTTLKFVEKWNNNIK